MNWKDYEKEVHAYFSQLYPGAKITYNAKVVGRYSKNERQIDVLIEDEIAGFPLKVVVDAKYFSENIDVKCVESFISMLEDVDASQGLLVTQKGYSDAAINRAYYGSQKLELDVLNFDELLNHQGLEAIPYSGKNALLLSAPFGWVIDNRKQESFLACLYQRGIDLSSAQKKQEWIYLNFWHKDKCASTIQELVTMQNEQMAFVYNNLQIKEIRSPERNDNRGTYIRIVQSDEISGREITGYIDCDEFIVFFVLFTRVELQDRNLRKLSHVLQYSTPFKIDFDNTIVIAQLEEELPKIEDCVERATACNKLANWYAEMDDEVAAMRYRRLCWDSYPEYYENIRPLIRGELALSNFEQAICYSVEFFSLAPENPRVMQDLVSIYENPKDRKYFEKLIRDLAAKYKDRKEAFGNICIHYAMYLVGVENETKAVEYFQLAKEAFKEVDKNHYVLQQIDNALDELA